MADTQKITARALENSFLCVDSKGAEVSVRGTGPRATDLLLMSVAGCSGSVLKSVLAKEGFTPRKLEMTFEGVRAVGGPPRFETINAHYDVECSGLTEDKLKECLEATELACPVIQTLNVKTNITFTLNK